MYMLLGDILWAVAGLTTPTAQLLSKPEPHWIVNVDKQQTQAHKLDAPQQRRSILFVNIGHTDTLSVMDTLGLRGDDPDPGCEGAALEMKHENHMTAAQARPYYTDDEWSNAFKVGIVRNPWDRLVSLYSSLMHTQAMGVKEEPLLVACGCPSRDFATNGSDIQYVAATFADNTYACSYGYFLRKCAATGAIEFSVDVNAAGENFTSVGWDNINRWPELHYLLSEEGVAAGVTELSDEHALVDFVMRSENLEEHFYEMLLAAGNNESVARACADSLSAVDSGSSGQPVNAPVVDFYPTRDLRAVSAALFDADARAFGYALNVSGPMGIAYSRKEGPS